MPSYTPSQLVAHAKAQGVEVSERQIEEWNKAGLLPEPTRARIPGQGRGRAPHQYHEPAPAVVVWLGTQRRFFRGDDSDAVVKFWLWLEGYDHIVVDPAAVVLARIQGIWRMAQETLPALPAIAVVAEQGVSEEQTESLLEALDTQVTQPMLQGGKWDETTVHAATVGASLFGFFPDERIMQYLSGGADGIDLPNQVLPHLTPEQHAAARRILPAIMRASQIPALYLKLKRGRIDFITFRQAWLMLTPDTLPAFWPALAALSPFRIEGEPKERADVMRLLRYDPFNLMLLAAAMASGFSAVEGEHPAE
jgi:hypothetical protein